MRQGDDLVVVRRRVQRQLPRERRASLAQQQMRGGGGGTVRCIGLADALVHWARPAGGALSNEASGGVKL